MDQSKTTHTPTDGGPAFPQPWTRDMGWSPRDSPPGMTLRDYFIAHAPHEPQDWFEPVVPNKPEPMLLFSVLHRDCTHDERESLADFGEGLLEIHDISSSRVRDYLTQREAHRKAEREHARIVARERCVQWPAAWADAMLRARTATEPTPLPFQGERE